MKTFRIDKYGDIRKHTKAEAIKYFTNATGYSAKIVKNLIIEVKNK